MVRSLKLKNLKETDDGYLIEGTLYEATHSKLAAALKKKIKLSLKPTDVVLYLGASHGYTPSMVAKICAFVFAVEISHYVVPDLVKVCESQAQKNIAPILADASKPETYFNRVSGIDVVYQDIAQKNQVEIFVRNCSLYLKKGGLGLLAVKCRSIDVTAEPSAVFKQVKSELEKHLKIVDFKSLEPFEKDHYFIVCKNAKSVTKYAETL